MLRLYSHNPMSLTIVSTMLYLWSPELAHFLPGSVAPVTNSSPSFLLSALTSAPMSSAFFLDSTIVTTVFGFLSLAYFHFAQHHPGLSMLLLSGRISGFPSFYAWILYIFFITFPLSIHLLTDTQVTAVVNKHCSDRGGAGVSQVPFPVDKSLQVELLGCREFCLLLHSSTKSTVT